MSHGTVVINSVYREEWYQQFYTCMKCKTEFMCDYPNVKYCPGCGRKIVGEKRVYTIVEEKEE